VSVASIAGERYRVERRLGEGGMATVLLAHDTELDRRVAVKLLAERFADDEEVRRRFLREGRLAARLTHPNVVGVFDAGEQGGRPYIVMEHVDGETLADVVRRRGRLDPAEAVRIALQACAGLEHAHAHGLVHRDVKPQNLLLTRDGTVKVADFGIARAADGTQVTAVGTILGTAAYLAPEQATGGDVGPAADVYALGAVLYELLAGRPPFRDDSLEALAARHGGAGAPPDPLPDDVPPRLEDAVMRALARLPEYRPPTAGAFAADLRAALGEEPTQAVERRAAAVEWPTEVIRTRTRPRARWPLAVVVAATLATLALAAALATGGGDDPAPPPQVEPVPPAQTPEEQARNLAEWLRENSG